MDRTGEFAHLDSGNRDGSVPTLTAQDKAAGLFVMLKQRAPRAGKYKLSGSLFATASTLAEPAV